jgi:hypothetical protein
MLTDIKNLSIALEALSRIPKVEHLSLRLLDEAITKTEHKTPVPAVPDFPNTFLVSDDIPF